jgi:hypothetical protein
MLYHLNREGGSSAPPLDTKKMTPKAFEAKLDIAPSTAGRLWSARSTIWTRQ